MPDAESHDDEPTVAPTTGELLLARIDEHCRLLEIELEQVTEVTEQLDPERARSCRNAITMASVMSTRSGYGPTPGRSTSRECEAYVAAALWVATVLSGRPPGLPVPRGTVRVRRLGL